MAKPGNLPPDVESIIATNRKARHMYFIVNTMEAGIVLQGTEVKSAREGRVNLADSYAAIKDGEIYLHNAHISPYEKGTTSPHHPTRIRKLLLHKKEIRKLIGKLVEKGYTMVALQMYFRKGKVKVELGLAKGKRQFDQREAIAKRDADRDMEREAKGRNRDW